MSFESRLKQKEDLTNDLEREASFFKGLSYHNQQSYLLFEQKTGSFNRTGGNINYWESTGIHNKTNINLNSVANSSSALPGVVNKNNRLNVSFNGNLLKQNKIAYYHHNLINFHIVYKLQKRSNDNPDFALENSLFGNLEITKNVDTSKYNYSGYGISFDSNRAFLLVII